MKNTAKTILKYVLKIALYLLSRCEQDTCRQHTNLNDHIYRDDYSDNIEEKGI